MFNLNISKDIKQKQHQSNLSSQDPNLLTSVSPTARSQTSTTSSTLSSPYYLSSRNTPDKFFKNQINPDTIICSSDKSGIVQAYAFGTNNGLIRNYNEDRVSIILDIARPPNRTCEYWPKCSFFGVYDGHGGSQCADFLRDNLHSFIISDPHFPQTPKQAIRQGFAEAQKAFIRQARAQTPYQESGSCAVIALIIEDICYIANVGDSRAVMSGLQGTKIYRLSKDHKPSDQTEQKRIINNGGKVYRSVYASNKKQEMVPFRVLPGRLSVSRTFGDIEAKDPRLGGNPQVLICTPDIKAFRVTPKYDFIVLASDGIFDKLSNRDVVNRAWQALSEQPLEDIHQRCGVSVEGIVNTALMRLSLDNLTVLQIAFQGFASKKEILH